MQIGDRRAGRRQTGGWAVSSYELPDRRNKAWFDQVSGVADKLSERDGGSMAFVTFIGRFPFSPLSVPIGLGTGRPGIQTAQVGILRSQVR